MNLCCRSCKHFKPDDFVAEFHGKCLWLENNPLPTLPFWAITNAINSAVVRPSQEGCEAHSVPLTYPEIIE